MILNEETVDAYTKILQNPSEYKFDFKPLSEVLVKSETITAQHLLFKGYVDHIKNSGVPKVIFYIILQNTYGHCHGKDEKGNAGYYLTVNRH